MQNYFTDKIESNTAYLSEMDSKHCKKVMRHKVGDLIGFTDGKGNIYTGEIQELAQLLRLKIIDKKSIAPLPYELHLVVAPTKNIAKTEWMIEKAVELGLSSFKAIWTNHSERRRINEERIKKIIMSAMKQSQKSILPSVYPASTLKAHLSDEFEGTRWLAHCNNNFNRINFLGQVNSSGKHEILIGPEGDFSTEEIQIAESLKIKTIHLGHHRLRTETAGVLIASAFYSNYIANV